MTTIKVNHPTDMFHIRLTFQDTFSFAKVTKETTVSGQTLMQMQESIGKVVIDRLNKATAIHETLKLISIERA